MRKELNFFAFSRSNSEYTREIWLRLRPSILLPFLAWLAVAQRDLNEDSKRHCIGSAARFATAGHLGQLLYIPERSQLHRPGPVLTDSRAVARLLFAREWPLLRCLGFRHAHCVDCAYFCIFSFPLIIFFRSTCSITPAFRLAVY